MKFTGVREFYVEFYRGTAAAREHVGCGIHVANGRYTSVEDAVQAIIDSNADIRVAAASGWTVFDVEVAMFTDTRRNFVDFYVDVYV